MRMFFLCNNCCLTRYYGQFTRLIFSEQLSGNQYVFQQIFEDDIAQGIQGGIVFFSVFAALNKPFVPVVGFYSLLVVYLQNGTY